MSGAFFWLGNPDELPDDFHKPFILSAVRIWSYFEGIAWASAWLMFILMPFTGFLAVGIVLFLLAWLCHSREDRWAERLKKEL